MTLEQLFLHYGSDKPGNGYVNTYLKYIAPIRDNIENFMEFGIGSRNQYQAWNMRGAYNKHGMQGASLRAWRDWLPGTHVWGIDPQRDAVDNVLTELRIHPILGNSTDASLISSVPQFDIIVDDGSHCLDIQVSTCMLWFQKLMDGGLYFIEDIQERANIVNILEDKNLQFNLLEVVNFDNHQSSLVVLSKPINK
jgi:hypothetical protein